MSHRLLIIDDNVTNLKVAIGTLEQYAYDVLMARNGPDGIKRARYAQPDLILLDIQMPEMDGYEVCRQLKADERTAHIPIIFVSALHEVFDKVTAFSIGGVDYVTKPFQAEELLARVQTHLALRQLQDALQQANVTLEDKVALRTAELAEANVQLQVEIEQRKRQQIEKDRLFELVERQSEQLRNMTTLLVQSQQTERQGLAATLRQEVAQKVTGLQTRLKKTRQSLQMGNAAQAARQLAAAESVLSEMGAYLARVTTNLPKPTAHEKTVNDSLLVKLSGREREVLQLVAQGKSNAEIGAILTVATSSVYTYKYRIKEKLGLNDIASLTRFAIEHELID